jgi:hypothetical protein
MKRMCLTGFILLLHVPMIAAALPDIRTVQIDLQIPAISEGAPAPGERVKRYQLGKKNTDLYHLLYLPTDWTPNGRYPVIVEYAGNGPFRNQYGDSSDGSPDDCVLGFGVSGGKNAIWLCLPYVANDNRSNQRQWWGNLEATLAYCKTVVPSVCKAYGGDPDRVLLAGFSRGAIACNYLGLHDDEISSLWSGFICYSHYDGVRRWPYPGSDRTSAAARLKRLGKRPQFIVHESSVDETQAYLEQHHPNGNFTFLALPYRNHNPTWVLRDTKARLQLRKWFAAVTK